MKQRSSKPRKAAAAKPLATSQDWFEVSSALDHICATAFNTRLGSGLPAKVSERALVFLDLLSVFGEAPGYTSEDWAAARACLPEKEREDVASILSSIARPSYTVLSYWSPLDLKRHSVHHRPVLGGPSRHDSLICAYMFFALTNAGDKSIRREPRSASDEDLYSATHFIAKYASRKMSPGLCYTPNCPPNPAGVEASWWHIPPRVRKDLLDQSGIDRGLADLQVRFKSDAELQDGLRNLFSGADEAVSTYEPIAEQLVREFPERYASLPTELKRRAVGMAERLTRTFHERITPQQAFFMEATHSLWQRACPGTNYAYTFPTLVSDTCCILTVGSKEPLTVLQAQVLAYVGKVLFVNPLLLDFAERDRIKERTLAAGRLKELAQTQADVMRRIFSHNLPKLLLDPLEIRTLKLKAQVAQGNASAATVAEFTEDIGALVDHLRVVLTVLESGQSLRDWSNQTEVEKVSVADVRKKIDQLFKAFLIDSFPAVELHGRVRLVWDVPHNPQVWIRRSILEEILLTLIWNAVEALDKRKVESDARAGEITIRIGVDAPASQLRLEIKDKGSGFTAGKLAAFDRANAELVEQTDEEGFYARLHGLLNAALANPTKAHSSGIGLLICSAMARSLRWSVTHVAAGSLKIDSIEGNGSTVTVLLPIPTVEFS